MVLLRAWYYLAGFVIVRVEGESPERFVNFLIARGICVWDIRRSDRTLHACMGISGFRQLRPIARKARCRVRIEGRVGLPFVLTQLEDRTALATGVFLFITALYVSTSVVWIVRVKGAENANPQEILNTARQSGLAVGALKSSLNLADIERNIVLNTRGLSWCKVRVQGTMFTIEVIEKAPERPREEVEGPCDVVASKSGKISSLLVLMGTGLVPDGAEVAKGQVLVSGAIYGPPPEPPPGARIAPPSPIAKYLHARAIVRARVPYTAYYEVPTERVVLTRTGETRKAIMVKIGKTQIIWKALGRPFAFSEVESSLTASWLGRNTSSFVELHNLIYHELVPDRIVLPIEEAKRLAQKAATEAASLAMPPEAERAQVSSEVFVRPGAVSVLVTIDAIEEIGVARPVRWP